MDFHRNDRVYDVADPRHLGRIRTLCHRNGGATVEWEETGWLSPALPIAELRHAFDDNERAPQYAARRSPINVLEAALECDCGELAASLMLDALGIADRRVAERCFPIPEAWPREREQRARIIAEWLTQELGALETGLSRARR